MQKISFSAGEEFDFGTVILHQDEIIAFAREYDPLEFHTDPEVAKKHIFKKLVSSGPHLFHHFYKNIWIPKFGKTVLCGLAVDNWRWFRPNYAGQKVSCYVRILSAEPDNRRNSVSVRWKFEFFDPEGQLLQHLEMLVLHRLNG